MLKCCRKDENYCGKHVDVGQPKREAGHLVKTWTNAGVQLERLCSGDTYEDTKHGALERLEQY